MPQGGPSVWFGALIGSLATGLGRIISAIPDLLGALVIILVGYGIAKLLQLVVTKLLKAAHFDRYMDREGITPAMQKANISRTPAEVLGIFTYWLVLLLFINSAAGVLGLTALTRVVQAVLFYLPRVLGALIIVLVGAWLASFLSRLTNTASSAAGMKQYSSLLAGTVLWVVLFFTFAFALGTLGVDLTLITTVIAIILGGAALAFAIAFGLGARGKATDILAGRELRSMFNMGDTLATDTMTGTVVDMRPTYTVVRTDKGDMAVENTELLHSHVTKRGGQAPPQTGSGGKSQAA